MSATYHRRQARGLCGMCGQRPPAPGGKCCRGCLDAMAVKKREVYGPYTETKQRYYATVIRPQHLEAREAPGVNQVACCGRWWPLRSLPAVLPCCGKYVGMKETAPCA